MSGLLHCRVCKKSIDMVSAYTFNGYVLKCPCGTVDKYTSYGTLISKTDPQTPPDGCPKCGDTGTFVKMALVCAQHGFFGGC